MSAPTPVPTEFVAEATPVPVVTVTPNGSSSPEPEPSPEPISEAPQPAPADPIASAQPHLNGKSEPPTLFSEAWAQAYQQAINNNPAYRSASLRWDAGSLAFVIHASPKDGFLTPAAVLLDLHRGNCRAAHSTPLAQAVSRAAFVIEGDYGNWIKVLSGQADPLKMLMRGALRLSKGSMLRLLPFTQSAQELVSSAQRIQPVAAM